MLLLFKNLFCIWPEELRFAVLRTMLKHTSLELKVCANCIQKQLLFLES